VRPDNQHDAAHQRRHREAYGVTSQARLPTLPNLPTLDEAGLKGFQIGVWNAVMRRRERPRR